jgi:DNA-directed RNA polymerase subunit L
MPLKKGNKYISNVQYPYHNTWDKRKDTVSFDIENVHNSITNALRRCMLSKVPTVGFTGSPYNKSTIKIHVNDTPLHNEFLIHRISMIQINYKKVEQYDEDEFQYEIDEFNNTNEIMDITTEHIKVKRLSTNKYLSYEDTRQLFPTDPITGEFVLITILKPKFYTPLKFNTEVMNQINSNYEKKDSDHSRLHFEARAKIGMATGDHNAHFCPAASVACIHKVDENKAKLGEEQYVADENEKTKLHNLTPYPEDRLRKRFQISEKERYFQTNDRGEPNKFTYTIESVGVIPPLVIFHQSIKILINKINLFISNVINKNKSVITIQPSQQFDNGYELNIINEDDTLGYLVQSYLSRLYCDYLIDEDQWDINYIGYRKPHPLNNNIIITIQGKKGDTFDKIVDKILTPGCQEIVKILSNISSELENIKQFTDEITIVSKSF